MDIPGEPFLPLTKEEEAEVERAFNSNRRKVLVTHENSNIEITGEILQCLRPGAWLNDEVINVYLELLKERENREPQKYLKCHFFNTFFYKKARYFVDEVKDKSGKDVDVSSWRQEFVEDLPEQENGFDCGMFMIKYADFYGRDIGLCFNQGHMPYFRQRTAKEILRLRAD